MATTYLYHVTSEPPTPDPGYRAVRPPNQKVNAGGLSAEIQKNVDIPITGAASVHGNTLRIDFQADLDTAMEAELDSVVASHAGLPASPGGTDENGNWIVTMSGPTDPEDKKPVFVISPATEGFVTWLIGAGDDVGSPPGRGEGPRFRVDFEAAEVPATKTIEFQFSEPIEVHDGQIQWTDPANWGPDDDFSLGVRCPATGAIANGGGTGNANKVPSGIPGVNILVPAAGDGAWDVDLAKAVPVSIKTDTNDDTGFWDVVYNTGEIKPSATPGAARWHLLDQEVSGWLIRHVAMTHPGGWFDIDVYKTEYLHPNWVLRWEVNKKTPGDGTATGWILSFRRHVS